MSATPKMAACALLFVALAVAGCAEVSYETGRLPGAQLQASKGPTPRSSTKRLIGAAQAAAPETTTLESTLRVGISTKAQVRAVLGEPIGRGEIMIPLIDKAPRKMWTYFYETGRVKAEVRRSPGGIDETRVTGDVRHLYMMIYFNAEGRFDGYQWFSSLPQHALRR